MPFMISWGNEQCALMHENRRSISVVRKTFWLLLVPVTQQPLHFATLQEIAEARENPTAQMSKDAKTWRPCQGGKCPELLYRRRLLMLVLLAV
jgi:hypothetical protein